eukprot:109-Amorphochlora_amoeboformis.AAC.1
MSACTCKCTSICTYHGITVLVVVYKNEFVQTELFEFVHGGGQSVGRDTLLDGAGAVILKVCVNGSV